MIQDLLQKKVIFVTGKGGTGKTSLSVALAVLAAKRGKKVLLAEVDMTRPSMEDFFGKTLQYAPSRLAERIDGTNVEFFEALRAYLGETISMDMIIGTILKNKVVRYFLESTPFAREIVILNTLFQHYTKAVQGGGYDLIIVDMPASGHTRSILSVPRSVFNMFRLGPLLKRAKEIDAFLRDNKRVCLSLVTLAEEMPVNETLEAWHRIQADLPIQMGPVFVNRLPIVEFSELESSPLEGLLDRLPVDVAPRVRAVIENADEVRSISARARLQVKRLKDSVPMPVCLLHELEEKAREPMPFRLAAQLGEMP